MPPKSKSESAKADSINKNETKTLKPSGVKRVDPLTGKVSDAPDAITYSQYRSRKKVDPMDGKCSDEPGAIAHSQYQHRKKVDPLTGKPSEEPNAVTRNQYQLRKKVDPLTGKPSDEPDAITYSQYQSRKKVDPLTGKPSDEPDAIARNRYHSRKKVDPLTGKRSDEPDAITRNQYQYRKKVDPVTGKPSDTLNVITKSGYVNSLQIASTTGQKNDIVNITKDYRYQYTEWLDYLSEEPVVNQNVVFIDHTNNHTQNKRKNDGDEFEFNLKKSRKNDNDINQINIANTDTEHSEIQYTIPTLFEQNISTNTTADVHDLEGISLPLNSEWDALLLNPSNDNNPENFYTEHSEIQHAESDFFSQNWKYPNHTNNDVPISSFKNQRYSLFASDHTTCLQTSIDIDNEYQFTNKNNNS